MSKDPYVTRPFSSLSWVTDVNQIAVSFSFLMLSTRMSSKDLLLNLILW